MATETSDLAETAETDTVLERPKFRGCVVCYSIELARYAVRKARR